MDVFGTCVFISCRVFIGYVVYSLVTVLTYVLYMLQIESENVLSCRHVHPITTKVSSFRVTTIRKFIFLSTLEHRLHLLKKTKSSHRTVQNQVCKRYNETSTGHTPKHNRCTLDQIPNRI